MRLTAPLLALAALATAAPTLRVRPQATMTASARSAIRRSPSLGGARSVVSSSARHPVSKPGSARSRSLVARAQEAEPASPPIPFLAPPLALALAYAIVKASPLDEALTGLIDGNGYPQMFRDLDLPGFFYKWFHAGNMAIAGGAMGGYGTWLGFETKAGRGDDPAWGALNGETKRELHKLLMAGAALVFAAGGLGGVTFMLTLNKSVFDSPHAVTGMAELLLFATQAGLAISMGSNPELRKAHASLGSITMGILLAHAALGLKLGLSL
mmetsp:Transcript_26452/g.41870  ORF Transcript_26452/g.41870 Transcript_26452/m.41870 type:complete len:269 (-) Transcript_26452:311-1117(-)